MDFVKGPLNYTGSKYPLMPQMYPIMIREDYPIDTFHDCMGGEVSVGINIPASQIMVNDAQHQVMYLLDWITRTPIEEQEEFLTNAIANYGLDSRDSKEGWERLKAEYNGGYRPHGALLLLIAGSFSNQVRFNSRGEFNLSFGQRYFNPSFARKYRAWRDAAQAKQLYFFSYDFEYYVRGVVDVYVPNMSPFVNHLFYFDPPYTVGTASYNEMHWGDAEDRRLLALLDYLHREGFRFALSNALENKGQENVVLAEWLDHNPHYRVHHLEHDYMGSNYQRRAGKTDEVLVTNYD